MDSLISTSPNPKIAPTPQPLFGRRRQHGLRPSSTSSCPFPSVGLEVPTPANLYVVGDDSDDGVARKKGKTAGGSTTKRKRGDLDAFVDRGLSEKEKAEVNLILLRYVYSAFTRTDDVMTHAPSERLFPLTSHGGHLTINIS